MEFKKDKNLNDLFKSLINNLQAHANGQNIDLILHNDSKLSLRGLYNPTEVYTQFYELLKRVINFTPSNESITVSLVLDKFNKNKASVKIKNTGMNLYRMREIFNDITFDIMVEGTTDGGTLYSSEILLDFDNYSNILKKEANKNNLGYNPYYKEIETKLSDYFKEIDNLQAAIDRKDVKQGAFLRKVNLIIRSHLDDNTFKVDALASAMALSRAQLFRKIKALTKMSPSEYLLYFRLHIARELLKTEKNGFNVSEVGYQVGFVSKSHFSRSFQKQFGISPSNFKNMQQLGNKSQQ